MRSLTAILDNPENDALLCAPLEWAALWAAMKASPAQWIPTTPDMFDAMLGAVPPTAYREDAFLVGEPNHHNEDGRAVYACFKRQSGKVYAKYLTRAQFSGEIDYITEYYNDRNNSGNAALSK